MLGFFPGTVNDAGWTASAYAGVKNLESKYNMEIAYTEGVKAGDNSAQLARDYADAGFQYIYAHSFDLRRPHARQGCRVPGCELHRHQRVK